MPSGLGSVTANGQSYSVSIDGQAYSLSLEQAGAFGIQAGDVITGAVRDGKIVSLSVLNPSRMEGANSSRRR